MGLGAIYRRSTHYIGRTLGGQRMIDLIGIIIILWLLGSAAYGAITLLKRINNQLAEVILLLREISGERIITTNNLLSQINNRVANK